MAPLSIVDPITGLMITLDRHDDGTLSIFDHAAISERWSFAASIFVLSLRGTPNGCEVFRRAVLTRKGGPNLAPFCACALCVMFLRWRRVGCSQLSDLAKRFALLLQDAGEITACLTALQEGIPEAFQE